MSVTLRDWKRYKGYLPFRMLKEDTVRWIGKLVGPGWLDLLWYGKYSGLYTVRFRFGDTQEVQIYMKERKWIAMPVSLWLKFSSNEVSVLDEECWEWIKSERSRIRRDSFGNPSSSRKTVARKGNDVGSLLGI